MGSSFFFFFYGLSKQVSGACRWLSRLPTYLHNIMYRRRCLTGLVLFAPFLASWQGYEHILQFAHGWYRQLKVR